MQHILIEFRILLKLWGFEFFRQTIISTQKSEMRFILCPLIESEIIFPQRIKSHGIVAVCLY